MNCLSCGDCCLRMSPISNPDPCPKLIIDDKFYFCSDYKNRPTECYRHEFPASVCPIGISKLEIKTVEEKNKRIDDCYKKLKDIYKEKE